MARVVHSAYAIDAHAQANGSRYVVEHHTLDDGSVRTLGPYMLPAGQGETDAQALMEARAARIDAELAERATQTAVRVEAEAKVADVLNTAVLAGTITREEARIATGGLEPRALVVGVR